MVGTLTMNRGVVAGCVCVCACALVLGALPRACATYQEEQDRDSPAYYPRMPIKQEAKATYENMQASIEQLKKQQASKRHMSPREQALYEVAMAQLDEAVAFEKHQAAEEARKEAEIAAQVAHNDLLKERRRLETFPWEDFDEDADFEQHLPEAERYAEPEWVAGAFATSVPDVLSHVHFLRARRADVLSASKQTGARGAPSPNQHAKLESMVAASGLHVSEITGGLSNRNFKVHVVEGEHEDGEYVVRVPGDVGREKRLDYASVHLVNRSLEEKCARAAYEAGTSPEMMWFSHDGVMVTKVVPHANTLTSEDMKSAPMVRRIVKLVRDFHIKSDRPRLRYGIEVDPLYTPMHRARNYIEHATSVGVTLPKFAMEVAADAVELERLVLLANEKPVLQLSKGPTVDEIVLLHCDLNPGNIMREKVLPGGHVAARRGGGVKYVDKLWLVDFEYCNVGHWSMDLANLAVMNDMSPEEERRALRMYLRVESLDELGEVTAMAILARHAAIKVLFEVCEGLWALMQEATSDVPFSPTWSQYNSWDEYGMGYLRRAEAAMQSDRIEVALKTLRRVTGQEESAARRMKRTGERPPPVKYRRAGPNHKTDKRFHRRQ